MQIPIQRILIPIDHSDAARHAAWIGLAIARSLPASLTLLHIHLQERARRVTMLIEADKLPSLTDELYSALLLKIVGDSSVGTLRGIFDDGVAEIVQCSFSLGDEITDYAGKQKTDLIVIGANIHSKLHDVLMGSVTNEVLENAKCSVTVVH